MARSNWSGSGGWGTINDPTGKLNGRVLVAQAGVTAVNEDYLLEIVGTTLAGTTFTYNNYEVSYNYAWSAGAQNTIFSGGLLGLIARAGNYSSSSGVSLAQNCYIARLNYQTAKAEIVKRYDGTDTVLQEADIPPSASTFGTRHTASFTCRGTDDAILELYIDGNLAVNIGDNTTTIITTGDSGIQVGNGTVFIDNFLVKAYGVASGGGYTGDTPAEFYAATTGDTDTFLVLWLQADSGVSKSGTTITGWSDSATLMTGYSLAVATGEGSPTSGTSLNGTSSVRFDHAKHQSLKGSADNALDINGFGSGDKIAIFFVIRFYKGTIGDAQNVSDSTSIAPLLNYGRSYQFRMKWDVSDDNPDREMQFDNVSNSPESNGPMFTVGDWAIVSYNTGGSSADARGFTLNGTQVENIGGYQPSNFDMSDADRCLFIGRRWFDNGDADYQYGSFEIAEVILANEGGSGMGLDLRQKTEGYLAHKWGLTSVLPSDHPYKTAEP